MLNTALGVTENFGTEAPAGCRAIEVGSSRVQNQTVDLRLPHLRPAAAHHGLRLRTGAWSRRCRRRCICMTDPSAAGQAQAPSRPLASSCSQSKKNDEEILDELFLATLTRLPSDEEAATSRSYREKRQRTGRPRSPTRMWALDQYARSLS